MKLPPYLKKRYLKTGLVIGALWGLFSMAIFVSVGMSWDENDPLHWLFRIFQDSVDTLWFNVIFLPFMLSFEAGAIFALFGSTPVGALIGVAAGGVASVLSYMVRR